jgi:DNA-binding GntR family transcriptional regulator
MHRAMWPLINVRSLTAATPRLPRVRLLKRPCKGLHSREMSQACCIQLLRQLYTEPMSTQPNASAHLRAVIEGEILTGTITPDSRLDEVTLAERFGVSRTPVREALQALAVSGLVEMRPRRGAIVSAPTLKRLIEMFELMAEIEAMCARLAARRLRASDRTAIADALDRCRRVASDPDAYYYENERFHQAIYAAAQNGFAAEQATALQKRLAFYRRLQLRVRNRLAASLAEHEAIVSAVFTGDEERAAREVRSHVAIQGERFSDLLAGLGTKASAS